MADQEVVIEHKKYEWYYYDPLSLPCFSYEGKIKVSDLFFRVSFHVDGQRDEKNQHNLTKSWCKDIARAFICDKEHIICAKMSEEEINKMVKNWPFEAGAIVRFQLDWMVYKIFEHCEKTLIEKLPENVESINKICGKLAKKE